MKQKSNRQLILFGAGAASLLVAAAAVTIWWSNREAQDADPNNPVQVALGRMVYETTCARCHGDKLQGEADWQRRKPSGRLPAPPHDASGHTWHHADGQLFGIIRNGITPYAPSGYQSDMPAFGSTLSDAQIWAVLAFIKSSWPEDIRERQAALSRR